MPPTEKKKGTVNKLRRFFEGASVAPRDIQQYRWMTYLDPVAKRRLYTPGLQDSLPDRRPIEMTRQEKTNLITHFPQSRNAW